MRPLSCGVAVAAALLASTGDAHATVVCTDLHTFAAIPSGGAHLLSLATSAIGLGASGARRGWYNAAIATVATNYAQSTIMVVSDAAGSDGCGEQVSEANMVGESIALAATTGLLVTVLVVEPRDEDDVALGPSVDVAVAPRSDGAFALVGGTF